MNVFMIENIELMPENNGVYITLTAFVKARVEVRCSHGDILSSIKLKATGRGMDNIEAIRKSIENLLNHRYEPDFEINYTGCGCAPDSSKMHFYFENLEEPFKGLFKDLFNNSNWTIPKLITA